MHAPLTPLSEAALAQFAHILLLRGNPHAAHMVDFFQIHPSWTSPAGNRYKSSSMDDTFLEERAEAMTASGGGGSVSAGVVVASGGGSVSAGPGLVLKKSKSGSDLVHKTGLLFASTCAPLAVTAPTVEEELLLYQQAQAAVRRDSDATSVTAGL